MTAKRGLAQDALLLYPYGNSGRQSVKFAVYLSKEVTDTMRSLIELSWERAYRLQRHVVRCKLNRYSQTGVGLDWWRRQSGQDTWPCIQQL